MGLSKYLPLSIIIVSLFIVGFLMGKLYFTQQDLLTCQTKNSSLEFSLNNQNKEILKYKSMSDKSKLNRKEIDLNIKYNKLNQTLTEEVNSCQSVIDTYLNLIKGQ